jgi:hypothetical protein
VSISGVSLSGADAGNYNLTSNSASSTANITARTLNLSYSGVNKVYDGDQLAAVTHSDDRLSGDALTLSQSASFADKNVGTGKTVNITGISLSGADASNYALPSNSASARADITAKVLTITGLQVADKTYDGSTNTNVTQWGQVNTGVGTETLSLNHGVALFDSANVGSRTVNATGYSLADGANGGVASNYVLSSTGTSANATISKAVLQVVANNDAKFITTNDVAGYAGVSYSGFVNGESAAVLSSVPTVSRSNSNVHTAGVYTGVLVPTGGSASNYSLVYTAGDYTVVPANQLLVRMAPVTTTYGAAPTYSLASASYYDPNAQQVVTLADASVGAANVVTVNDGVGGRASFAVTPRNGSLSSAQRLRVGVYALGVSGPVTENSQNFSDTITLVGSQTVTPKPLAAVSTQGVSKVYDGTTSLNGVNFVLNAVDGTAGVANGDLVSVSGNGDYNGRNVGTQLGYVVNNLSLAGTDASNYYLVAGRSFTGNNGTITPKALTLVALTDSKVYDGSTRSRVTPASGVLAAGDSISDLTQTFDGIGVGARSLTVSAYTLNDGNGGGNYVITRVPATGTILPQEIPPQPVIERKLPASPNLSIEAAEGIASTAVATAFTLAATGEVSAQQNAGPVACEGSFVLPPPDVRTDAGAAQDAACLRVSVLRDVAQEKVGLTQIHVPHAALSAGSDFVFSVPLPVTPDDRSLQAFLRDGSVLPHWLTLDVKTNRFTASKVPAGGLPLTMRVQAGSWTMDVDLLVATNP